MVRQEPKSGPNLNAMGRAARIGTRLGLMLLALTALSLVTMPFTQHMWTWDRFLHGGQDFETGALVILTTLNLVLVLAKCCKQNLGRLLTLWRCFAIVCSTPLSRVIFAGAVLASLEHRVAIPDLPAYQLPLLI